MSNISVVCFRCKGSGSYTSALESENPCGKCAGVGTIILDESAQGRINKLYNWIFSATDEAFDEFLKED